MMNKKILATLAAFAAVVAMTGTMITPATAQKSGTAKSSKTEKCACGKVKGSCEHCKADKSHAAHKGKGDCAKCKADKSHAGHKDMAGAKYQCQHCKAPMSLAEAKKKGMECCGMKMMEVKASKKAPAKKKG